MIKALFLDRDGTINVDYGYVYQKEKFEFIEGIFEFCQKAQDKGYQIIVITNQSGIARGYYTEEDFQKITAYMKEEFAKRGIRIKDVLHCPRLEGEDRKPNAGLFKKAQKKYGIDMGASISVGDKERDVIAGQRAGVRRNFLLEENNFKQILEVI